MNTKTSLIGFLLISSLSICYADNVIDEKPLIEQLTLTKNSITIAREENRLWRDTQKIISQVENLISNKNYSEAQLLLNQANFQIKRGREQADSQADINTLLPYYLKP